jgi:hypothetical protein
VLEARFPFELLRDLVALEVGQAYIEKDDIRAKRPGDLQGGEAIDGELAFVAHHFHQQRHRMDGVEIVFDDKHTTALHLRRSKRADG